MRLRNALSLAVASLLVTAGVSQAALVVNVDIGATGPSNLYSGLGAATGATGTVWNELLFTYFDDGATKPSLVNDIGGSTSIGVTVGSRPGTGAAGSTSALFGDYAYVGPIFTGSEQLTPSANFSFTYIPVGTYDVYYYGSGNGSGAAITVDGVTKTSDGSSYGLTAGDEGKSYVVFHNISVAEGGSIVASFAPNAGGNNYGALAGAQLVAVVPEPASISLLGLASVALLRRRRQ